MKPPIPCPTSAASPEQGKYSALSKRLGLSPTVAAQIERYRAGGEKAAPVAPDEAVSVFRLVGRRPEAALVFAYAGRRAARYAARSAPALVRVAPGVFGRRLAGRVVRRVARSAFGAELRTPAAGPELRMTDPLSIRAWPRGEACSFYGSAFAELLRNLTGFEGTMRHESCSGRGDPACLWRAARAEGYE
jgi:predicted hydrocarbon binding protein